MAAIRIVLADDHPIMRDGLRGLLERETDLAVVGEAEGGTEALRLVVALVPDVLILDMALPDLSGVEVARQLRAANSPVRVLGLSAHDDVGYIRGLLESGAGGYLTKDEARERIVEAVRGVAHGETGWLSRRAVARLMTREVVSSADTPPVTDLSEREREVLRLVARGRDNVQIAAALGIAAATVRKHVETIFGKLGVHKRSEAVAWAWACGLADDPRIKRPPVERGHHDR